MAWRARRSAIFPARVPNTNSRSTAVDDAGTAETPKAAAIHNNLALLLRDRGEHKAARAEFEQALAIYRREYGEDHYRTIGTTQNLAAVLLDTGDIAAALPLLERTSAQNLRLFGTGSSDYANSQNMLGNIARQQKRYDESIAYYARAEASYRAGPRRSSSVSGVPALQHG